MVTNNKLVVGEMLGGEGLIVRCDELDQTQRRKDGSKKTDYDANPRLLHSREGCSWTFCARTGFRPDLPLRRLSLLEEGWIHSGQNLLSTARIESGMANESETEGGDPDKDVAAPPAPLGRFSSANRPPP